MRVINQKTDERLIELAQSGDRASFALLLERHYDLIYRIGFRLTGRRDISEDFAQDICMTLVKKIEPISR